MPYRQGRRLPGETASKTGHIDVIKNPFVKKLVEDFESEKPPDVPENIAWEDMPEGGEPLETIFSVDGSKQVITSQSNPPREIAFIKTAILRIDEFKLARVNKENPNPFALRDLLTDSATHHATAFPLKHVTIPGMNTYDTVRKVIFESLKNDPLKGAPLETLKWIAYEKWSGKKKNTAPFHCPHCMEEAGILKHDTEKGACSGCGRGIYITDYLGFHLDMTDDVVSEVAATSYMNIHETLLLFTGIRHYWETDKEFLTDCLFIKDGPLSFNAQYTKLVAPVRRFLAFARDEGYPVHVIGQEKTGFFCDHLELIGRKAPAGSVFIPGSSYIKTEIQRRADRGQPYGLPTNYAAKVLVKANDYHQCVLNIPTGEYKENPVISDLIGADRIFATLPRILSSKHEGALYPVELAHGIASLSTYPSAEILKLFSESYIK